MIIGRRDFLNLLGVAAGAAGLGGCGRDWAVPDRLVELALRGPGLESEAQSICGLCEGGCGLSVRRVDGMPVGLKGNPNHPLNRGGLCPVGQAGLETLYAPNRLQGPLKRGTDGGYDAISWDEALTQIADRLSKLRSARQGARIAFLSGEPSSVFHDLARQFLGSLGSPNLAGPAEAQILPYALTQGADQVPGFDFSQADLVLSFGLDLYEDGPAPLHAIAAMIGSRASDAVGSVIHVGTRLSPSAVKAEKWVAVRPGTHGAFALGVAHVLVREDRYDRGFVREHTLGFEDWTDQGTPRMGFRRLLLERYYPDRISQICGCDPAVVVETARRFADAARPVAIAGGEAVLGSNATWNVIAIHALNALIGAFDRPGGVTLPFPIPLTSLPSIDASIDASESVFTGAGKKAPFGLDPVEALADLALAEDSAVEVLLISSFNPVHESPAGDRLAEAMQRIPMTVAFAAFLDETARCAEFVLPSDHFLETWQAWTTPPHVAFSVLGLGEPVVERLFDTRHPGDVLLDLGRRVLEDDAALPWSSYADYLKNRLEGLAASAQGSVITGTFEESWKHFLEERGWRFLEGGDLESFWTHLSRHAGWWNPVPSRGDWARLFQTPSGRYEFFSQTLLRRLREWSDPTAGEAAALQIAARRLQLQAELDEICLPHYEPPSETGDGSLILIPFRPITARGSLGAASPMVLEMFGYPLLSGWQTWAELASPTAHELGIEDGDRIALESDTGSIEAVARLLPWASPGVVHVPFGLGHTESLGAAADVGSNPVRALAAVPDNLNGSLSLNLTRVRVRLIRRRPHGGPPPMHAGGHS